MARTFEELAAACRKDPYPFPMPGGEVVMIAQPTITTETAAVAAATSAGTYAEGLLAGLVAYAGDDGGKVAEAWGAMPTAALHAAVAEMQEHFAVKSD